MHLPIARRAPLLAALLALLLPVLSPAQQAAGEEEAGLPLEPTRTLRMQASEGTWTSLDVSPDGARVVFDLLGDLYTVPLSGGPATRLTHGMAYDVQPRFSPDGERVVFVSDRDGSENLWLLELATGDTTQVTDTRTHFYTSPAWSPTGDYVVASRAKSVGDAAKLWLYHTRGGAGVQLVEEPKDLKMLGAEFGADPRYIWYSEATRDWNYNAELPQYQLALYDRETGTRTTMTSGYGGGFRPALSPDGRWLAYGRRYEDETGLRLRDLRTGEERWLVYPIQHDDQESRATLDVLPGYDFTPDSREVVIAYDGRIWRVPVDGAEPRQVAFTADVELPLGPELDFDYRIDDSPTFTVRQIRDAVPSPDGRMLAFSALDRVWIVELPGGTPRRLTDLDLGEHQPTWSPDGRSIAFVTWRDEEGGHIYRAPVGRRGGPERLTAAPALYRQPAWSPDGERIVALRYAARDMQAFQASVGGEFVWVPARGGEVSTIAPTGGLHHPHFTRSAERIYAYDEDEGLVSMRWDGTDRKQHLKVTGSVWQRTGEPIKADLVLMGPDGERALAEVRSDLYVIPVPQVGAEAPTVSVADPGKAIVPVRKLTEIGGQFPTWGADGRAVHWSIGNAHFVYDLRRAEAVADSLQAARARLAGTPAAAEEEEDDEPGYRPAEHRVSITIDRDLPQGLAVLRGGRAITMQGGQVIADADILVRGNRIAAVGPRGQVDVPAGAEVIDVSGTTIVPGFVDTHAHLRPSFGIHVAQPWQYLANLAYGVTTTRDPQTSTTDVLTYGDLVEAGTILGPRIYSTGPGVFGVYLGETIESLDHARRILRRYSDYYDTKTFKMYLSGNRQQRQWLAIAARELELMPTTEGGLDFALDVTHAIDGYAGVEHNLPVFPIFSDIVQLFATAGTTYTPTLLVDYGGPWGENFWFATENAYVDPKLRRFTPQADLAERARRRNAGWFLEEEYAFPEHAEFVADLVEAGGTAGVGSHGQLQGLGFHWELWSIAMGGLSSHDALRVATILGAHGIGLEREIGSIEPGKVADLVILDANPLDDIRNTNRIRSVMKNGRLYEAETLDEIWPRRRPLPAQPWRWEQVQPPVRPGR